MKGPAFLLAGLLAFPLAAQSPRIGPTPSSLFVPATPLAASDSGAVGFDNRQSEMAFFGMVLGGVAGYFISTIELTGGTPTCDFAGPCDSPPRENKVGGRVAGAVIRAVVGLFVGSYLGRPRTS